jgi:hypothetical protein
MLSEEKDCTKTATDNGQLMHFQIKFPLRAIVAELVYALVLGTSLARGEGSIPSDCINSHQDPDFAQ